MAGPGTVFLFCCILVLLPQVEVAKNSGKERVKPVKDAKEFKKILRTSNNVLAVFASSEKDYNKVKKLHEQVAEEVKDIATLVFINCGEDKKTCKKLKVSPSNGVERVHYKDGQFNKDYDRKDTVKSLVNFMRDPTGDLPWDEDQAAGDVVHLNSAGELKKLLKREMRPLLIMFYAPWCGHCKRLKPEYAQAATELKGQAVLSGMDVDKPDNMNVRAQYNITGFPTLIYFENGEEKYKYGGGMDKDGLVTWMKNPSPPKEPEKEAEWADEPSDVVHLLDNDFDEFLANNPSVLVMFYAPWCGHCKKMKPEYTEAAATMKEEEVAGTLAAVDATKAKELGKRFGVKGFPTVKYFKDGEFSFDFNARTADKIVEFMEDPQEPPPPPPPEPSWADTESEVLHLSEESFKPVLKKKKHTLVMFYAPWCGHCKNAKPEYMQAAEQFKDDSKVAFAAVDCTLHMSVCKAHDVGGYPTFVYFNYGKNDQKYTGGRQEADFVAFMKDPLNPLASAPPPAPSPDEMWAGVEGGHLLAHLNEASFSSVLAQHSSVLVMFYAPWCGHCKSMKPAFGEAAKILKEENIEGLLATVDATAERSLGTRFEVKGYPTIKYFKNGEMAFEYSRGRTAFDIVDFMKNPSKPAPAPAAAADSWADEPSKVEHLSGTAFPAFAADKAVLVMFYAPWCGHCKRAKPEFTAAAEEMAEGQALAAVDCTVERDFCQKYDVKGYPTIKYFVKGKEVEKYSLGRTKDDFVSYMQNPPKAPKEEL